MQFYDVEIDGRKVKVKRDSDGMFIVPEEYRRKGRWPANVILTHDPRCEKIGEKKVKSNCRPNCYGKEYRRKEGSQVVPGLPYVAPEYADSDGTETVEDWRCHPDCPVRMLDEQSDPQMHGAGHARPETVRSLRDNSGDVTPFGKLSGDGGGRFGDTGGASRFFKQCQWGDEDFEVVRFCYAAKASRSERNRGLGQDLSPKTKHGHHLSGGEWKKVSPDMNFWPTVKPLKLMEYLIGLLCPPSPEAVLLDPFMGSGSTLVAAKRLGKRAIGIEIDEEACEIAVQRIKGLGSIQQTMF